jgi:putative hydrolase of the HAD superfamily
MADLKHLFFDLDDTLWDYESNSRAVLQDLFREFGLEKKISASFEDFFQVYKKVNLELWSFFYKRQINKHQLRDRRWNLVFGHFGYHNKENHDELTRFYVERAPFGTCLKDGCIDTLSYLQSKYKLHLITNGFREIQDIKIDGCGLRGFFSNIIICEEHDLVKPELKVFRLAEKLAGCKPQEAVMIGDSLESDIHGALGAGWQAVYFSNDPGDFRGSVIRSLEELKQIF